MTTEQAVKIIKEMLFGKTEVKMAEARLMDGTTVTNNLENDFEIGQTLYVVDADGALVLAPAGQEHQRRRRGTRIASLDTPSVLGTVASKELCRELIISSGARAAQARPLPLENHIGLRLLESSDGRSRMN